jgi:hypothetical protein
MLLESVHSPHIVSKHQMLSQFLWFSAEPDHSTLFLPANPNFSTASFSSTLQNAAA